MDALTPEQSRKIEHMYMNEGHGPHFIGINLDIPTGAVYRFIESKGWSRTIEQAREAKKKNRSKSIYAKLPRFQLK